MSPSIRSFFAFLIPGGIIYLAAVGFLRPHGLPQWMQGPVHVFPLIVLVFGFFFGWYLSSSRLILSLMAIAGADRVLILFPPTGADHASMDHIVFAAITYPSSVADSVPAVPGAVAVVA